VVSMLQILPRDSRVAIRHEEPGLLRQKKGETREADGGA